MHLFGFSCHVPFAGAGSPWYRHYLAGVIYRCARAKTG